MITIDEYPATSLREYESRFQELTTENNRLRSENLEWLARQHENEQRLQQIERAKYLAVQ